MHEEKLTGRQSLRSCFKSVISRLGQAAARLCAALCQVRSCWFLCSFRLPAQTWGWSTQAHSWWAFPHGREITRLSFKGLGASCNGPEGSRVWSIKPDLDKFAWYMRSYVVCKHIHAYVNMHATSSLTYLPFFITSCFSVGGSGDILTLIFTDIRFQLWL